MTRRKLKAQNAVAYWVRQMTEAKTGGAALNEMWSWTLGSLAGLAARHPERAEAARYHLARQLAVFSAQLPEAQIEMRAGLTEDEARQLLSDPWNRKGAAR